MNEHFSKDDYKYIPAIDCNQQITYQKGYHDGYNEGFNEAIKILQEKNSYMMNTQSIEIKFNSDEEREWFLKQLNKETK